MMILSLGAMTELKKSCITNAYLQWLFHSGERAVAHGPLVYGGDGQMLAKIALGHKKFFGIYANIFAEKNVSSFCICKSYSHFFSSKKNM